MRVLFCKKRKKVLVQSRGIIPYFLYLNGSRITEGPVWTLKTQNDYLPNGLFRISGCKRDINIL